MQEIILKIKYFERGLSKSLENVNFVFLLNPVPWNGQDYENQKEPLLVMYYLTKFDGV